MSLRRHVGHGLQGLSTAANRAWSSTFGRHHGPPLARWAPAGGPVVVLAPHPDDECAGCAGAILRHREAGDPVTVVTATDGRRSKAFGLEPVAMAATRRREASSAADRLDASLRWIGLPEGEWEHGELVGALDEALEEIRPVRVYAPSRADFHPEHHAVALALASALGREPGVTPEICVYPIQVPLDPGPADYLCSVDGLESAMRAAFEAHASQLGSLVGAWRTRRYAAARHRTGKLAETFWRLNAADYQRLHDRPVAGNERFFGLRWGAWNDPWVLWRNRRPLRRLQAEVEP